MVGLLAMPDHAHRLRLLHTKKIFEDLEKDFEPTFDLLYVAMKGSVCSRQYPINAHYSVKIYYQLFGGYCASNIPNLHILTSVHICILLALRTCKTP